MSLLENSRRIVALESTPGHGNVAVAELVGRLATEAGLSVEYQRESDEGVEQCNLIARPAPGRPAREILFQTHLDTAEPGHLSHWTKTQANPFNASLYGDELYGLGVADAKLDFLCKLEALAALKDRAFKTPPVLVGTFGALTGMSGAIKLIRRKKLSAVQAVVGGPTDLALVHAAKGLAVIEISIPFADEERDYRRDHDLQESASSQSRMFSGGAPDQSRMFSGGAPDQSRMFSNGGARNAIMSMLEYLAQLPDGIAVMELDGGIGASLVPASAVLEIDTVAGFKDPILPKISRLYRSLLDLERELLTFREEGFEPPHPTVNLGMVRTTETDVRVTGCVRLPPTVTDAIYEGWMKGLEGAVRSIGATFRVKDYRKGFHTPADSPLVRAVQGVLAEMGLDPGLRKAPRASEASVFSRHGIECVLWGPGVSVGNSHGPNESIKMSDLSRATEFYGRLMERLCS